MILQVHKRPFFRQIFTKMSTIRINSFGFFINRKNQSFKYNNRTSISQLQMSRRDNQPSLSQFPSIFSSSLIIDDLSIRNQFSLKFMNIDENNLYGFASFDQIKIQELSNKRKSSQEIINFQLKRCTSFQEILMENHRNVLIQSIKEYFQKIEHQIIKKYQMKDIKLEKLDESKLQLEIMEKSQQIERILVEHEKQFSLNNSLFQKCKENAEEIHVIYEIMNICPEELQFQVLYLIANIFAECNQIIQHFKRKNLSLELKNSSTKLAKKLLEEKCLNKLFQTTCVKKIASSFQNLVQKCMITLFLMKVGVFQNELETKSTEQCLKSQIFKQISLNDLLNQHLIRPSKKIKQE